MGWDLSGLVAGIAVPVTVISAMRFMRRYSPTSAQERPPKKVEAIADENLGGAEKAVNAAMVVVGTVSGYGTYRLLLFANNVLLTLVALRCFNSCPQNGFGFSCRSFGALCISWDHHTLVMVASGRSQANSTFSCAE
jgi:hypothetical protein